MENTTISDPEMEIVRPNQNLIMVASAIAIFAGLSQFIVIVISRGLSENFSAKTFLLVQAVAEIAKQTVFISYAACAVIGESMNEQKRQMKTHSLIYVKLLAVTKTFETKEDLLLITKKNNNFI